MEKQGLLEEKRLFSVTSSPHIRTNRTTKAIMIDVIIALLPALIGSIYLFGTSSAILIGISVVSCVIFELLSQKLMKRTITISDFSAVVTGILIAFNLPSTTPYWVPVFGAFMAIVITKQLFGGIGSNFVNPALIARATIMISWPDIMSNFENPIRTIISSVDVISQSTDAMSQATPLGLLKNSGVSIEELPKILDLFLGNIGGSLGETSALLLLIGAIYLIIRKVIDWQTPIVYIIATSLTLFILGVNANLLIFHILSGGLILGAFFMATDYTTTPVSLKGRIIFAIGAGVITAIIRVKGGMPEGVSYSILFMNILTPLIEKISAPKVFGRDK